MTSRRRWLPAFLLFTYYAFLTGSTANGRSLALRVTFHLVTTLIFVVWLVDRLRHRSGLPITPIDKPLIAWVAVGLIASLIGLDARYSLERLWNWSTFGLGFVLFVDLRRRGRGSIFTKALFMTTGVVCLVGLFEWISWYLGIPFLPGVTQGWPEIGGWRQPLPPTLHRITTIMGGPTPLAGYLAAVIPLILGQLLTARETVLKLMLGLLLAAAATVEILTFSRGGVLALSVALPILGLGWLLAPSTGGGAVRRWWSHRKGWIAPVFAASAVVLLLIAGFWLRNSFSGRSGSTTFRFTVWGVAWEEFQAHPMTGVGVGNFGRALLQRNDRQLPRKQITTAHNVYLNVAAEMGLVGLGVTGWLAFVAIRAWHQRWKLAESAAAHVRLAAAGASLAAFAAQQLVDTFDGPANWLPVLVAASFILGGGRRGRNRAHGPVWVTGLTLLVVVGAGAGLLWTDVAQLHFERSAQLAAQGNVAQAVGEAEIAERMDPTLSLYDFQVAATHAQKGRPDEAIDAYRDGLRQEPVWGKHSANLSALLKESGSIEEAIEWMERTVQADDAPLHRLNLGLLYEQVGRADEAWEQYARVLAGRPTWAGSGFWSATDKRSAAWSEIVRRVGSMMNSREEEALLEARFAWARGEPEEAERHARNALTASPDSTLARVWLGRALLDQGRAEEAVAFADEAVDLDPSRAGAYSVRGCAQAKLGEGEEAERDLRAAIFLGRNNREALACLAELNMAQGERELAIDHYRQTLPTRTISQNEEVALYGRAATFDLHPTLIRIGWGPKEAAPCLELARLYEANGDRQEAEAVYETLLIADPYLTIARKRLDALAAEE